MVQEMLMLILRSGKRAMTQEEVADGLGVPCAEVPALYRQARDLGLLEKFAHDRGMLELTGCGRAEARRLVTMRGGE